MEPVPLSPGQVALLMTLLSTHIDTLTNQLKHLGHRVSPEDGRVFAELQGDYQYASQLYQTLHTAYDQRNHT